MHVVLQQSSRNLYDITFDRYFTRRLLQEKVRVATRHPGKKWSPKLVQHTIARIYQARMSEAARTATSITFVKDLRFDVFVVNWFKENYGEY